MAATRDHLHMSRLRWAMLIPIAAFGFTAAAAMGRSGSSVPPPAPFLGPSSAGQAP
jgi:hypothetical protein